jgi:hypothetical protein
VTQSAKQYNKAPRIISWAAVSVLPTARESIEIQMSWTTKIFYLLLGTCHALFADKEQTSERLSSKQAMFYFSLFPRLFTLAILLIESLDLIGTIPM